jgi:hypothetical protein
MADIIKVQGRDITVVLQDQKDYISLTDIAKHRNPDTPADIVKNWMRSRSTIEFLGLWEQLNNPDFKLVEFDQFRSEGEDRGAKEKDTRTSETLVLRRRRRPQRVAQASRLCGFL